MAAWLTNKVHLCVSYCNMFQAMRGDSADVLKNNKQNKFLFKGDPQGFWSQRNIKESADFQIFECCFSLIYGSDIQSKNVAGFFEGHGNKIHFKI